MKEQTKNSVLVAWAVLFTVKFYVLIRYLAFVFILGACGDLNINDADVDVNTEETEESSEDSTEETTDSDNGTIDCQANKFCIGMTLEEVLELAGDPSKVEDYKNDKGQDVTLWTYTELMGERVICDTTYASVVLTTKCAFGFIDKKVDVITGVKQSLIDHEPRKI